MLLPLINICNNIPSCCLVWREMAVLISSQINNLIPPESIEQASSPTKLKGWSKSEDLVMLPWVPMRTFLF